MKQNTNLLVLARRAAPIALAVAGLLLPFSSAFAADGDLPSVASLLRKADDLTRGSSSKGVVSMHIKTAHWERNLKMEMASQGTEKTLIRILAPAKEKGTTTLKVDENIWNYLPKVDRTIKVPASMMSGSWMGSHFTNDDLVKESRFTDDFDCTYVSTPEKKGVGLYRIACIPKPDAPVVWGKVVMEIDAATELISRSDYFDEKGKRVRTMTFSDVKKLGGRLIPSTMTLRVADKPEEFTEVIYESLDFDLEIPARTFSLQALRR